MTMLTDFADLWERAAVDGTPVDDIVGDDPVAFAEDFAQAYSGKRGSTRSAPASTTRSGKPSRRTDNDHPRPGHPVQGLEKSFKDLHVLRGVDFDVARGSIFALLGSNGAGKTTVVRILSTLLKADAGTATVDGFDVAGRRTTSASRSASRGSSPPSTRC